MNKSMVILPKKLWEEAKDKEELKQLISNYMKRYGGYRVIEIHKYYAVCDIGR